MKTSLCLALIVLSGCAHVSDYSQGCRDGINAAVAEINEFFDEKHVVKQESTNKECDRMDEARKHPIVDRQK